MLSRLRFCLLLLAIALLSSVNLSQKSLSSKDLFDLVNRDRALAGLPQLGNNPVLDLAALAKAQDMIDNNYFAHVSPLGVEPWQWFKNLGYRYAYAGENLAEGFADAAELENSWMSSPKHRANILSPLYSEVGLAVVTQGKMNVIVQFFGSPEKVSLRK